MMFRYLYELPCTWNYHTWQCRPDGTENPPIERQKTGLNMCPGSSYCIIQSCYYPALCRGCLWWYITTAWQLWGIHLCWWSIAEGCILLLEGGQSGGEEYQHGGQGDQEGGGWHHSQVGLQHKEGWYLLYNLRPQYSKTCAGVPRMVDIITGRLSRGWVEDFYYLNFLFTLFYFHFCFYYFWYPKNKWSKQAESELGQAQAKLELGKA